MTDQTYLLDNNDAQKSKGRWVTRLLKFIFFVCAFFLIIFTILANMGGSNETLHGAVENFASELAGGRPTKLKKLNNMSFFPKIAVDFQGLIILLEPESLVPIMSIGRMQVSMDFFKVATQTPRFASMYIEDVKAIKGVLGPNELYIEKIFIDHDVESKTAVMRGKGKSGIHPWTMSLSLDVFGKNGKYSYMIPNKNPIVFDIADIHFEGVFENHKENFYKLENFTLKSKDHKITGNLILSALGKNLLKIKGDVDLNDGAASLAPEVVIDFAQQPTKISGELVSSNMGFDDVVGDQSVFQVLMRIREILGYTVFENQSAEPTNFLGPYDLDFRVDLKKFAIALGNIQDVGLSVVQEKGMVKLGPVVSGRGQLFPAVLMVRPDSSRDVSVVFQSGQFSYPFAKAALPNLPEGLMGDDDQYISCGLVGLTREEAGYKVNDFGVNLRSDSSIYLKGADIVNKDNFKSLVFKKASRQRNLQKIELSKYGYDFIQSSVAASGLDDGCANYISAKPEEQSVTQNLLPEAENVNTP